MVALVRADFAQMNALEDTFVTEQLPSVWARQQHSPKGTTGNCCAIADLCSGVTLALYRAGCSVIHEHNTDVHQHIAQQLECMEWVPGTCLLLEFREMNLVEAWVTTNCVNQCTGSMRFVSEVYSWYVHKCCNREKLLMAALGCEGVGRDRG